MLEPGVKAPDFTLTSEPGKPVSLASLRGQAVILAFYPADWSPVCSDQMALNSRVRSGVNGTPTFFINGARFDGAWDEQGLFDALSKH